MELTKKKGAVIIAILGLTIFGYSQYASASYVEVSVVQSDLLHEDKTGTDYSIELLVKNPSLLVLTAGDTNFFVMDEDDQIVGTGKLEPFTLQPMQNIRVSGMFHTDPNEDDDKPTVQKITGVTTYDIFFTSIDVPFVYYPTDEQAMEFIR